MFMELEPVWKKPEEKEKHRESKKEQRTQHRDAEPNFSGEGRDETVGR